jgi:hypothetical protein
MKINWQRFLWVLFIACYTSLFFFNFFEPFENWFFVYIYTLLIVYWLCSEYYQRHNFFQSGLLFDYHWAVRAVFALFFYSSFIIGLATTIWWSGNKIGFYPFVNIAGIAIFIVSVFLRWKFYLQKNYHEESVAQFYHTLYVFLVSLALGYGSMFLLIYVVVVGFPLVFLQTVYERRHFQKYASVISGAKTYYDLQQKYFDHIKQYKTQEKKRGAK